MINTRAVIQINRFADIRSEKTLRDPGYHYFKSESTEYEEENARIFCNLSLYTRFRIFLDIVVSEYLSHVFVFRWLLNIVQIFVAFLGAYPLLPLLKFGKKYALAEVMKTRKSH